MWWKRIHRSDLTFQYGKLEDCLESVKDFNRHKGTYPKLGTWKWKTLDSLRIRVSKVADKYAHYNKVIMVCHEMVIKTLVYKEKIDYAEVIEFNYEIGNPDVLFCFDYY